MTDDNSLSEIVTKILEQETAPEMLELKQLLLRKIIMESDVKPSRIPAPLNITEIGGYFNLMMKLRQEEMVRQTLVSILGLSAQTNYLDDAKK
ncbi:MAG: hypothetical protein FWH46_00180 [Methanimicrococcus sp.]|nr:hypothetical protein [Methanimicrococcus sp.]